MDYRVQLTLIVIAFTYKEVSSVVYDYPEDYAYDDTYDYNKEFSRSLPSTPKWPEVTIAKAGMKLRLTQKAFDYLSSVSEVLLAKELEGLTMPPVVQDVGIMTVNISHLNITENPPPKISVQPIAGFGLRVTLSEMAPHVKAVYDMDVSFFSRKKGTMDVASSDVKFVVDLQIGRDNTSRPTVEVVDCNGAGFARAKFAGQWSDALNAVSVMFGKEIKSLLFAQICWRFKQDIGQNLTMLLQKAPVSYVVAKQFELNFGLTQFPYFSDSAMETVHEGAIYLLNKEGERDVPPFDPPQLPAIESHNRSMLYIYISSYTLNSAGYAAFHSGRLAINVTKSMIPGNYGEYLKTTCPGKTCVGSIFPQLGIKHPDTEVSLQIKAKTAPTVNFKGGKISLNAAVDADIHVANDGRLLTITANLTTECQVAVKEGRLLFNFTEITPTTTITDSVIPELNGSGFLLNGLTRMAVQQFLKPKLAEIGRKGIALPTHKLISITNGQIIFEENLPDVIVIAGDVHYLGPMPTQAPSAGNESEDVATSTPATTTAA